MDRSLDACDPFLIAPMKGLWGPSGTLLRFTFCANKCLVTPLSFGISTYLLSLGKG